MKQIKRIVLCLCIVFSIILVSESFEPTTVLAKTEKQATKKEVRAAKKAYKKFLVSNKVKDTHFKLVYLGDNPIPYLVTGTPFLSETRNGKRIRKNKDSCMEVNIYTYKNKKVKYCTLFAHSGSSPRVLYNKRSLILTRFCLSRIYFSKGKLYQEDLTYDDYAPIDISQKQFDSNFNVFSRKVLVNGEFKEIYAKQLKLSKADTYRKKHMDGSKVLLVIRNTKKNRDKYI